jgi:hypothetical protein
MVELAVADDEAKAAMRQEISLVARYIIAHAGDADVIALPLPELPVDGGPATQRAVNLCERP